MLAEKLNDMQTRDEFFAVLSDLRAQFDALKPELEVTLRDPAMGVEGYIVVWNTGIARGGPMEGTGKGGTRLTKTISLDEVKMLARTMALKNAAAGLPLGGSKSGLKIDPDDPDFARKYARFAVMVKPFLHENGGAFGGFGFDIGGRPEHVKIVCDAVGSTRCFTGKPVEMGGTDYDREGIAGLGVATAAKALIESRGAQASGKSFAVQGLGAMGAAVVRYFSAYGGALRAVADPKFGGTWVFDAPASAPLIEAIARHDAAAIAGMIAREARNIGPDAQDVLFQDVDVLFPCAIQNVITETNSNNIKARFVAEGANQPVTREAYPMLKEKGIDVVPDFIANPGGVIAAFVELTSVRQDKVAQAKDYTVAKITDNVRRMMELADRFGVEPVHAGLYLALRNIFFGIEP